MGDPDDSGIIRLDGEDSVVLNRKGWFLVTYYQSRFGGDGSVAHDRAVEKANSIKRETGIRRHKRSNYVVWEVWEKW